MAYFKERNAIFFLGQYAPGRYIVNDNDKYPT